MFDFYTFLSSSAFLFVSGGGAAFLMMGLTEAIVKPISMRVVRGSLKAVLPNVYEKLDRFINQSTKSLTVREVEEVVSRIVSEELGRDCTAAEVAFVDRNFSLLKCVGRNG